MGDGSRFRFSVPISELPVPSSQGVSYFQFVAKPAAKAKRRAPRRFPWLLFILLFGSAYVLWALPYQLGVRRISVDFEPGPTTTRK